MSIHWFPFIAQIINFLVLVWLLRRFLYGPVVEAMRKRKETVQMLMVAAEEKLRDAEQLAAHYQQSLDELERKREETLVEMEKQLEQEYHQRLQTIRHDAEEKKKQWYGALQREQDSFLKRVQHQTAQEIQDIVHHILKDLASTSLENQVLDVFMERLQQLETGKRQAIVQSAQQGGTLTIRTAFHLPLVQQRRLVDAWEPLLGPNVTIEFEHHPELICGIELHTYCQTMTWSLNHYLNILNQNLVEILEQRGMESHERLIAGPQ